MSEVEWFKTFSVVCAAILGFPVAIVLVSAITFVIFSLGRWLTGVTD